MQPLAVQLFCFANARALSLSLSLCHTHTRSHIQPAVCVIHWKPQRKRWILTSSSEALGSYPEAFGPGQKMILEFGQTFALGHLHADLVLLGRHAGAFTEKQELGPGRPNADYWESQTITQCTSQNL